MEILRSLLFIPAGNIKLVNKIDILKPDVFLLDIEDSVPIDQKEKARENIKNKIKKIDLDSKLKIYIRINGLDTEYFPKDIEETINLKISGYMIPKFEDFKKLNKTINFISENERKKGIPIGKIKLILMIESAKGLIELNKLNNLSKRLLALTIGWEDFIQNINVFTDITPDILDFVRTNILMYSKANNLLAIDTIYRNFTNDEGLRKEALKVSKLGFNGKLAIHPRQIDIINNCFSPSDEEIKKMEIILQNKDRIQKEGAININEEMYDPPHLKWALKIKEYLDKMNGKV